MTKTQISRASSDLFDYSIRVEKVVWLLGCAVGANDELRDAIDDDEEVLKLLEIDEDEATANNRDELATLLYERKKHGFLVQAVTPIPDYAEDLKSYRSSWGSMRVAWFYTDALDPAFIKRMIQWRNTIHDEAKAAVSAK